MAVPPGDPFALVGHTLDDRFAIDSVVARGGFGIVYRGRQLRLRKSIALKVLFVPPGLDPSARRLFLDGFAQEAQTIAQLSHPGIVQVFDFGVSRSPNGAEIPWMALEWIDGQTLADFLKARQGRPLSPAEALAILRPVVQALAFAHAKGFAHRDIKPSNIMLMGDPGASLAGMVNTRLLDFGIAKVMAPEEAASSGETRTDSLLSAFSLPYASPEQKAAMKTGPWTDVHALGLVLTEMLTGCAPYPGADRIEIEFRIMSPERPTPARFQVDAGPWEAVIRGAVALRAPDRFQDAGSFLAALEANVPTHAVTFNVPSTTEPMAAPHGSYVPPVPSRPSVPGAVLSSTITDSPTVSGAPRGPRTSGRALTLASAAGAVLLVVLAVVAGVALLSRSNPSAPASSPDAALAAPPVAVRPAERTPQPVAARPAPPPVQAAISQPVANANPARDASVGTVPPVARPVAPRAPSPRASTSPRTRRTRNAHRLPD